VTVQLPLLVSPAGSHEIAEAAFAHGADAVYVGLGQTNLRAHCPNFTVPQLAELVTVAHAMSRRVYAALNILPYDEQMPSIQATLREISAAGTAPDAFIVSDPGVLVLCQRHAPSVPVHWSTQAGTFNTESMRFWQGLGVLQFVLPREFTLAQIAAISRLGETEVFIHGAMCMAVSGRCLMGAHLTGRHPNLGDCPQYCRLAYEVRPAPSASTGIVNATADSESDQDSRWLPVIEDADGSYLMNSKDLCCLSILPQLVRTGARALKIEGRNKSIHYVSSVVRAYRAALDAYARAPEAFRVEQEWLDELERVEHRPYTTGFYAGDMVLQEVRPSSRTIAGVQILGIVRDVLGDGRAVVDVKFPFAAGDVVEVLPRDRTRRAFEATIPAIRGLSGQALDRVRTHRLVVIHPTDGLLCEGDVLRMKSGQ